MCSSQPLKENAPSALIIVLYVRQKMFDADDLQYSVFILFKMANYSKNLCSTGQKENSICLKVFTRETGNTIPPPLRLYKSAVFLQQYQHNG